MLVVLAVSCWSPYYDPKVSAALPFYSKLGAPFLSIGPLSDTSEMGDSGDPLEFIPTRPSDNPLDPVDGFLVRKGVDVVKIGFVESYNGSYRIAPMKQSMTNSLGAAVLARAQAANGSSPQLILMRDDTTLWQYAFDPVVHAIRQDSTVIVPYGSRILGIGARLLMPSVGDADTYAALYTDGTQNLVAMSETGASLGGFASQVSTALDTGGRSLTALGSAFQDVANHRFYYSQVGGPALRWDTAAWPASSGPPTALSIPERLTAMLSDGTLVAQNDTYLTAYSADGKKLFSVSAGSVRLEQEVYYTGTTPSAGNYVLFSQVLSVKDSNGWEFYVNVWRYPVASFASLGN
jgi:hypothetical protein